MNNLYTDSFSESLFSQHYEYKQKYTSKRKHVPKDSFKQTYDKARDKASYREATTRTMRFADEPT